MNTRNKIIIQIIVITLIQNLKKRKKKRGRQSGFMWYSIILKRIKYQSYNYLNSKLKVCLFPQDIKMFKGSFNMYFWGKCGR